MQFTSCVPNENIPFLYHMTQKCDLKTKNEEIIRDLMKVNIGEHWAHELERWEKARRGDNNDAEESQFHSLELIKSVSQEAASELYSGPRPL